MALQSQKQVFQGEWEGERVAAGTEPMSRHVGVGVQGLGLLGLLPYIVLISGLHGHANQCGYARAGTDGFHDGNLLLDKAPRYIAREHVIGQRQSGKLAFG